MSKKEELIEKLKKVKALADQGYKGEQEVAQKMLEKMMEVHGISLEDIEEEKLVSRCFICYKMPAKKEQTLLMHLLSHVIGDREEGFTRREGNIDQQNRYEVYIQLTAMEYMELLPMREHYSVVWRGQRQEIVEHSMGGFIAKNDLFSKHKDGGSGSEATEEDLERARKAQKFSLISKEATYRKSLSHNS